jgi:hypothetical protein
MLARTPNASADAALDLVSQVPRTRYYTRPDNSIDMGMLRKAAKAFRRDRLLRKATVKFFGGGSIRGVLDRCVSAAATEAETMRDCPYSAAADAVDAAYGALGISPFDPVERALAVLSFHAGRPAVGTRCWGHSTITTQCINAGADTMDWAAPGHRESPCEYLAAHPTELTAIVPLNAAGARLIERANRIAAGRTGSLSIAAG